MSSEELLDRVSETDRKWFESHPGMNEYTRRYVNGELGESVLPVVIHPCEQPMVRVIKLGPDLRMRVPLFQCFEGTIREATR